MKKLTVLDSMDNLSDTWTTKVSANTIMNCFRKGDFAAGEAERDSDLEVHPPPRIKAEPLNACLHFDDSATLADEASPEEVEEELAVAVKEMD